MLGCTLVVRVNGEEETVRLYANSYDVREAALLRKGDHIRLGIKKKEGKIVQWRLYKM